MPRITIEPGRAISARITLYRVLGIKHGATGRIFVTVNGGMSDNPASTDGFGPTRSRFE